MAGTPGSSYGGPITPIDGAAKLRSESPIDDLATHLMQSIARRGRGFVLDVGADGKKVEVVESLPPIDDYEAPAPYRGHRISDTASFIAYCQRYGKADQSLVFVGEDRCVLVLDEGKAIGAREMIELKNLLSRDWAAWSAVIDQPLSHKSLGVLLRRQEHNLVNAELLVAINSVRSTATVSHESDLRDMGASVGVAMRVAAGEEMAKFPKRFAITVPVLAQDELDAKEWIAAEMAVEVLVPDEPGKPLAFALHCSTWGQLHRARLGRETDCLRAALDGWIVVQGSPVYAARTLGRRAEHYIDLAD